MTIDDQLARRPAGDMLQAVDEGRWHWTILAACRSQDPEIFFPAGSFGNVVSRSVNAQYEVARQICDSCPVVSDCLRAAIARDEPFGMWGGRTPNERMRIARRLSRSNAN